MSTSHWSLWEAACRAIAEVAGYSPERRRLYREQFSLLPPLIPTGDGTMYPTTLEGDLAITRLGQEWWRESDERQARIEIEDACQLARTALGRMVSETAIDELVADRSWLKTFKRRLQNLFETTLTDSEHYFPCRIIDATAPLPFQIGPVMFRPAPLWMDWMLETAGKCRDELGVAAALWSGASPDENLPSHIRSSGKEIAAFVGQAPWVAAVRICNCDPRQAYERARLATRLAVDGLGLAMRRDMALNLRGPGDEIGVRRWRNLSRSADGYVGIGLHSDHPILRTEDPDGAAFLTQFEGRRRDLGWAIEILCTTKTPDRSRLRERWCDALYWFGDARRDPTAFTALVKYGIALDILVDGEGDAAITRLACALFGVEESYPLFKDGPTVRQSVELLYKRSRSQLSHGTRRALLVEPPFSRERADSMAARLIRNYLRRLANYSGPDEVDAFLEHLANSAGDPVIAS